MLGSEGSAMFGRPCPIEGVGDIKKALTEAHGYRCAVESKSPLQAKAKPGMSSHQHDQLERASPPLNISTQAAFATQLQERGSSQTSETGLTMDEHVSLTKAFTPTRDGPFQRLYSSPDLITNLACTVARLGSASQWRSAERLPPSLLFDNEDKQDDLNVAKLVAREDGEMGMSPTKSKRTSVSISQGINIQHSNQDGHSSLQTALLDMDIARSPFEGFKRVPRTYTRVPSVQKRMLAQEDCWFAEYNDVGSGPALLPAEVKDSLESYIRARDRATRIPRHQVVDISPEFGGPKLGDAAVICKVALRNTSEVGHAGNSTRSKTMCRTVDDNIQNVQFLPRGNSSMRNISGLSSASNVLTRLLNAESSTANQDAPNGEEIVGGQDHHLTDTSDGSSICSWPATPKSQLQSSPIAHLAFKDVLDPPSSALLELPGSTTHFGPLLRSDGADRYSFPDLSENSPERSAQLEASLPPSAAQVDDDFETVLPRIHRWKANEVPTSSIQTEDELDVAVPHAIGEGIDGHDAEMINIKQTAQVIRHLSPIVDRGNSLVQVEHTPQLDTRGFRSSADWSIDFQRLTTDNAKSNTLSYDPVWSDPIIIAGTFDDAVHETGTVGSALQSVHLPSTKTVLCVESSAPDQGESFQEDSLLIDALHAHEPTGPASRPAASEPSSGINRPCQMSASTSSKPSDKPRSLNTVDDVAVEQSAASTSERETVVLDHVSPINIDETVIDSSNLSDVEKTAAPTMSTSGSPRRRRRAVVGSRTSIQATIELDQRPDIAMDAKEMARLERIAFTARLLKHDMSIILPDPNVISSTKNEGHEHLPNKLAAIEGTSVDRPINAPSAINGAPDARPQKTQPELNPQLSGNRDVANTDGSAAPADAQREELGHDNAKADSLSKPSFDRFKLTYPNYVGNRRDFTRALIYIEWLKTRNQLVHRTLCDDFIRVNAKEYVEYVRASQSNKERLMTGWEYYNSRNEEPECSKRIITPDNLSDAISSLISTEVDEFRSRFQQTKPSPRFGANASSTKRQTMDTSKDLSGVETSHREPPLATSIQSEQDRKNNKRLDTRVPFFETPSQIFDHKERHTEKPLTHLGIANSFLRLKNQPNELLPPSENNDFPTSEPQRFTGTVGPTVSEEITCETIREDWKHNGRDTETVCHILKTSRTTQALNRGTHLPSNLQVQDNELPLSLLLSESFSQHNRSSLKRKIASPANGEVKQKARRSNMATPGRSLSFKDFVTQRRKAQAYSTSLSEAVSDRMKRVCTKVVDSVRREPTEPHTQAWEF